MLILDDILYRTKNGLRTKPWVLRQRPYIEAVGLGIGLGLCVALMAGFLLREPVPSAPTEVPVEDLYAQWFGSNRVRMELERVQRDHPSAEVDAALRREILRERRLKAAIEEARP